MLSHPKFLWFYVMFFGITHILIFMLNGEWAASELSTPSTTSVFRNMFFAYTTVFTGDLAIFGWILNVLEIVGAALILFDLAGRALSFFKIGG